MGPRNRRRLALGGIGLAVIAAIVVAVILLTSSANHSGGGTFVVFKAGPGGDERYAANNNKLVFGMTKRQVRRLVGPPTKIVGSCWQYQLNESVTRNGNHYFFNADRVCFYAGHYSVSHFETNGTWR